MRKSIAFAVTLAVLTMAVTAVAGERKLTAEEVVARHLQSIASPEALAGLKSRGMEGVMHNAIVTGGVGNLDGGFRLTSAGQDLSLLMRFPSTEYPGERITTKDGKVNVDFIRVGGRSPLGNFIYREPEVLQEGLLGGVLSSAWPLLNGNARQAQLKYDGLKKINGVSLHQLTYVPKDQHSKLQIRLYFDPATFRHVRSSYRFEVQPGMLSAPIGTGVSAIQHITYVTLDETFSDFRVFDGFTLPTHWNMLYIIDNERGLQINWEATLSQVVQNPTVDPQEFLAQ